MAILNFDLIKSPINWFIVVLMVLIGAYAFEEILRFAGAGTPGDDCGCHRSLFPVPNNSTPSE